MTVALADLANATSRPSTQGPRCGVCIALAILEPQDVADLTAALRNQHAAPRLIAAELQELGVAVKAFTVNRHIRGECAAGTRWR